MKRLIVRVVERRTRLNAMLAQYPACDLRFSSTAMIGERVTGESGAEKLAFHDRSQRLLGGESGGIRSCDAAAAGPQPRDSVFGIVTPLFSPLLRNSGRERRRVCDSQSCSDCG